MYAMNANVDSTVLRSFYYNPYVTQGVGHTPSYYAGGGAGHGLNPLYMGSGYAAAIASLYSGLPSAAALGPVDRDDGVEKLIEGFGKLCIGEVTVTERVRREKGGSAGDLERYEENLCLLMQDFERKARHEYVLTREWPKPECEEAALTLSGRLDGVEWRKVAWRPGYMEELDLLWRAKVKFAKRDQVYQVVWEFVAGMGKHLSVQSVPISKSLWS